MNNSIRVKPEDTLNVVKVYIESNYGYENASAKAIVHEGCNDQRDYEPSRVEFCITAKKDLGLGIGISEINISLSEKEVAAIITKKLTDQNVQVERIDFEKQLTGGYRDETLSFTGIKIHLPVLESMKNIGNIR